VFVHDAGAADLFLGHRRLAIIDLTNAGRQPLCRYLTRWISFNGEIFNYVELRRELSLLGYSFTSSTDTEVILAAFDCWGPACVERFNGDWAFAIFDSARRTLFLSRDRYGVKPLYIASCDGRFAFASEIKALLQLAFVGDAVDEEAITDYVLLRLMDDGETTLYRDIKQLCPGHNMEVDLRTGATTTSRYYRLPPVEGVNIYDSGTARQLADELRSLLFDAVRLRLRADVPVGSCLSGGLDSSSVVAIAAQLLRDQPGSPRLHTFTAVFPGEKVDESRYASMVVDSVGAIPHLVRPSHEGFQRDFSSIVTHHDEPVQGPSVYAQWEVMREAARHVTVTLDGQAGDEVFGGYRTHRLAYLGELLRDRRWGQLSKEVRAVGLGLGVRATLQELKGLPFVLLPSRLKSPMYSWLHRREQNELEGILGRQVVLRHAHLSELYAPDLDRVVRCYVQRQSLPHLLKYADRSSMAHSIEARLPFTDHRIVDFGLRLPGAYKIRNGYTKYLLRKAVEDLLPPGIVWRKDKVGFATPPWASHGSLWPRWVRDRSYDRTPGTDSLVSCSR
jgi:asparagine synthase (glutamine-hydrolysing)